MSAATRVLVAASALLATVAPASAAPALWQVSDADSKIWLFGSFHLLPPSTEWRTDILERTMAVQTGSISRPMSAMPCKQQSS